MHFCLVEHGTLLPTNAPRIVRCCMERSSDCPGQNDLFAFVVTASEIGRVTSQEITGRGHCRWIWRLWNLPLGLGVLALSLPWREDSRCSDELTSSDTYFLDLLSDTRHVESRQDHQDQCPSILCFQFDWKQTLRHTARAWSQGCFQKPAKVKASLIHGLVQRGQRENDANNRNSPHAPGIPTKDVFRIICLHCCTKLVRHYA